jgi:hypothetical protein
MPDLTVSVATGNPISVSVSGSGAATATVSSGGTATVTVAGAVPASGAGKVIVSSGAIADLTSGQQAQITQGVVVVTTDGYRWVYSGAGSVTSQASYVQLADITPTWSAIEGKPDLLTLAGGAMDEDALITLSTGSVNSEVGGWGFGVEVTADNSQYATVEPTALSVHNSAGATTLTPAGLTLANATQVVVGSFDNKTGGANGLGLICAVGYELNWQGGRLRSVSVGGNGTPQPIVLDSPITLPAGGITFADSTVQTTAASSYTLPTASSSVLGGVKIGSGVTITGGVISVSTAYAATSHSHGNLTADGKIGTVSERIVVTTEGGAITTASTLWGNVIEGAAGEFLAEINEDGIYDALDVVGFQFPSYGNIANNGAIGTTANLPIITTTGGVLAAGSFGTAANTFCQGNDSRLSDSRNPTSHTHAADDITSGTIATARLGSGTASASTFLRGDQTYAAPPVTSVDGATGAITVTKAVVYEFTRSAGASGSTGSAPGPYTWAIPSGAKLLEILMIGGGGGGGSGRRGPGGTTRAGGGGGASGGVVQTTIAASLITTSLTITVGSGGAGGASATTDATNGQAGTAGTVTELNFNGQSSYVLRAEFGNGGAAGAQATSAAGGTAVSNRNVTFRGITGRAASTTSAGESVPEVIAGNGNISLPGAAGGSLDGSSVIRTPGAVDRPCTLLLNSSQFGSSISGGAAATSGAATAGASAVQYGGGGCGGGASADVAAWGGGNSGAGGNGGDGYVRITVWF